MIGSTESRSSRLQRTITDLLRQAPEIEAAAVVSFDGLPMASALPAGMDEDRVAAMSAALLSLGERAAQGLGRGELSQVYIEGENGTVFLVSADNEAVLVAVAAQGAKVGMMRFEVLRAAAAVADALRAEDLSQPVAPEAVVAPVAAEAVPTSVSPEAVAAMVAPTPAPGVVQQPAAAVYAAVETLEPASAANGAAHGWSSYAPSGTVLPGNPPAWS